MGYILSRARDYLRHALPVATKAAIIEVSTFSSRNEA